MSGPAGGGSVTCARCGTANAAGDEFCGNCGAPIVAASLADGSPADGTLADAPRDDAPPVQGETAPAGLVRCPTCGTANATGRSFCQKCGGKLAGAAAVSGPRPLGSASDPAPSAGASAGTPTSAPPSVARPAVPIASPSVARRREPIEKEGGLSSWLVVAGAGIAVGAIAVVLFVVLGSSRTPPPAAASQAPTASIVASPRPSAGASSRPLASDVQVGFR